MGFIESTVVSEIVYGEAIIGGAAAGSNILSASANPVPSVGVDPITFPIIRPGSVSMDCEYSTTFSYLSDIFRNVKFFSVQELELFLYEIFVLFFGDMIILYGETSSTLLCYIVS